MVPWLDEPHVVLYRGDCRDALPALEHDSVRLLFTDPFAGMRYAPRYRDSGVRGACSPCSDEHQWPLKPCWHACPVHTPLGRRPGRRYLPGRLLGTVGSPVWTRALCPFLQAIGLGLGAEEKWCEVAAARLGQNA